MYKGGEKHASIQLEQIKDKAKQYTHDEERRKQITALLFKYKQGLSYTELQTCLLYTSDSLNLVLKLFPEIDREKLEKELDK